MTLDEALTLYLPAALDQDRVAAPDALGRDYLITAGREAARWRRDGATATALILQALHDDHGFSFGRIEQETRSDGVPGIDHVTSQRLIRNLKEGRL